MSHFLSCSVIVTVKMCWSSVRPSPSSGRVRYCALWDNTTEPSSVPFSGSLSRRETHFHGNSLINKTENSNLFIISPLLICSCCHGHGGAEKMMIIYRQERIIMGIGSGLTVYLQGTIRRRGIFNWSEKMQSWRWFGRVGGWLRMLETRTKGLRICCVPRNETESPPGIQSNVQL